MHNFRKRRFLLFNLNLTALNTAHIENVVDQTKQVIAGRGDFRQIILYLLNIVNMRRRERCKTDNRIHRRSDIV